VDVVRARSVRDADEAAGEGSGANLANLANLAKVAKMAKMANMAGTGEGAFFTFTGGSERRSR